MVLNDQVLNSLNSKDIGKVVRQALEKLLDKDSYLLAVDANERTIAARLCMYLQTLLPSWDVDCEYNRDGVDPKRLSHLDIHPFQDDIEAKTVFPDIVVHMRGSRNNLLVIEIKKSTNTVPREIDFAKLRGYKRELDYMFALFIELSIGDPPTVCQFKWVDSD